MNNNRKVHRLAVLISAFIVLFVSVVVITWNIGSELKKSDQTEEIVTEVLGIAEVEDTKPTLAAAPVIASPTAWSTPVLKQPPTPTAELFSVTLVDVPNTAAEDTNVSFTWNVNGVTETIHSTGVYFGTAGRTGPVPDYLGPQDLPYDNSVKDFTGGTYVIPLRFVGNAKVRASGQYFARAHAFIKGRHYWSEERSFSVIAAPVHVIAVTDFSHETEVGKPVSFTWDISGPQAETGFSVITGGTVSKPGSLDTSVVLPDTPYRILVADFTRGTYRVPLRFVGSTTPTETGTLYFRALSFINGKNIWSEEYSLVVR